MASKIRQNLRIWLYIENSLLYSYRSAIRKAKVLFEGNLWDSIALGIFTFVIFSFIFDIRKYLNPFIILDMAPQVLISDFNLNIFLLKKFTPLLENTMYLNFQFNIENSVFYRCIMNFLLGFLFFQVRNIMMMIFYFVPLLLATIPILVVGFVFKLFPLIGKKCNIAKGKIIKEPPIVNLNDVHKEGKKAYSKV